MNQIRPLLRKVRQEFAVWRGKEIKMHCQISIPHCWHGNVGAGFFVAEENLSNESTVYSFGVGEDISFDCSLIEKFGLTVHAFDPTPKSSQYIHTLNLSNNFIYHPYGLFNKNGEISFFLPKNTNHVSGTFYNRWKENEGIDNKIDVPVRTFASVINELKPEKIDILKMDIEGSEYYVIDDILNSNMHIPQILVEFHHRFPKLSVDYTLNFIEKMNNAGYKVFGVSESYEEYSFLKAD